MRIGVFGGSFDPIHIGHLIAAEAAADALTLDEIRFVPAARQPFKGTPPKASSDDRVAMLRIALEGEARFRLDLREIDRGGISYTVETLEGLRHDFPTDALFLLVGADAAAGLPAWRDARRLTSLATIVALSRSDDPPPEHDIIAHRVTVPGIEISATSVRAAVAAGRSVRFHVPAGVFDYIRSRGLYQREAAC